jgi:hypothetical protein
VTRLRNLYISIVVASTILAGTVGAIRLDTLYRLLPLGEDWLVNATGRNPHTFVYGSITCNQLQTKKYADAVPAEDCTKVGTSCIDCDSAGTNIEMFVETISGNNPPGVYLANNNVACGRERIGTCTQVGSVILCEDLGYTKNQCPTIVEYANE